MAAGASHADIEQIAAAHPEYARHAAGAEVSRLVIVPGRIVNIVTR